MKVSKRHMTILETLISMALTAIVLSSLAFFYHQVHLMGKQMDLFQDESFEKRYVENRLSTILPRTLKSSDTHQPFYFYSGNPDSSLFKSGCDNLVFTYDNCVNLDKQFSNVVLGRLYVNLNGELCLAIWPSPKRWEEGKVPPLKKEILMTDVEKFEIEFFVPPERGSESSNATIDPGLKGCWISSWDQRYKVLPGIIRLRIQRSTDNSALIYAFPLPHTSKPITYD